MLDSFGLEIYSFRRRGKILLTTSCKDREFVLFQDGVLSFVYRGYREMGKAFFALFGLKCLREGSEVCSDNSTLP